MDAIGDNTGGGRPEDTQNSGPHRECAMCEQIATRIATLTADIAAATARAEAAERNRDAWKEKAHKWAEQSDQTISGWMRACDQHKREAEALRAILTKADGALHEAEAILGGEYGDHYSVLCDRMLDIRSSISALTTPAAKE